MIDPSLATVREPLPADHDDAPGTVLDELRQAFTGTPPAGVAPPSVAGIDLDELPPAAFDDFSAGVVDTEGLPPAEPWVVATPEPSGGDDPTRAAEPARRGASEAPAALGEFATGDVRIVRRRPGAPHRSDGQPPAAVPSAAPTSAASAAPAARHEGPRADRATIVIGGDDELPDPVYLDDGDGDPAAGESTGGQTFVIGDELEASGALDAVQVPSRSMDPRGVPAASRSSGRRAASGCSGGRRRRRGDRRGRGPRRVRVGTVRRVPRRRAGRAYTTARYGDRLDAIVDEMMGEPVLLVDTPPPRRHSSSCRGSSGPSCAPTSPIGSSSTCASVSPSPPSPAPTAGTG
ncbi:MAG: hypothetical protein R2713_14675 [Ilumatobacteraceae bacterium]